MSLYGAIDLHSTSNVVAIVDEKGGRLVKKKLRNDPDTILSFMAPHKPSFVGVVVESTYNWYWLVDLLMDEGYPVRLANPSAIKPYTGLKHTDDTHDAFWLADLLRLGILPEGYIYPKQTRPLRDLLRRRGHLVRLRTSLMISLKCLISRNFGLKVTTNTVGYLKEDRIRPLLGNDEHIVLAGMTSKEAIDFLSVQIKRIESAVGETGRLLAPYHHLMTIPGVGKILAMTIMLETGPISRFAKVGNYVSYCRKVASTRTSNDKIKGKGNVKNGNKYLSWAFAEAAAYARRYHRASRDFYNRKRAKKNVSVAHSALAHKLARAAYYIMRDNVAFEEAKLYARAALENGEPNK